MRRKTSIVAGTVSACVVALALGVAIPKLSAQPADEKRAGDDASPAAAREDRRPAMSPGSQELALRARDMLSDVDKVKGIRKDLVGSGADVDDIRHTLAREQAEREMMRDPELRAKIEQMAKDPEIAANAKTQTLTAAEMKKDEKMMRRMVDEMVLREASRQQRMGDTPRHEGDTNRTDSEKRDSDNR